MFENYSINNLWPNKKEDSNSNSSKKSLKSLKSIKSIKNGQKSQKGLSEEVTIALNNFGKYY